MPVEHIILIQNHIPNLSKLQNQLVWISLLHRIEHLSQELHKLLLVRIVNQMSEIVFRSACQDAYGVRSSLGQNFEPSMSSDIGHEVRSSLAEADTTGICSSVWLLFELS